MPPQLVHYQTEVEYRNHYEDKYCRSSIYTFDGFRIFFPKQQFDDAFFESANRLKRDKSVFSRRRAERMDWIGAALQDSTAELYAGWDRDKKMVNYNRRVTLVYGDYVVILNLNLKKSSAIFITAYIADAGTITKIRGGPKWEQKKV